MNDIKEESKIRKLAVKRKSDAILKIMKKADTEVFVCCLDALADISDEAASNEITRNLGNENSTIKIAACKAALKVNTDYMITHIRYLLSKESDPDIKKQVQELLNDSKK
ncbi:MAG: hypothetical protein GX567_01140 [Clostridia bacterium]|nr:hypothetical protein [Clostridia bacterium]